MEQPLETPRMPPKKKVDFATEQFLRAVKHWTDLYVSGEIKVGIFLNSIQDDSYRFCKSKDRMDEWEEFIQDYMSVGDSEYQGEEGSSSGEVIDVDEV